MNAQQIRRTNDMYRDEQPSAIHIAAYKQALRGETIPVEARTEMIDRLYESFPESDKDHPVDPWEPILPTDDEGNGLGRAVTRDEYHINVHISDKLYHQQPLGVLLRPINDAVRKAGEALVTDVTPRAEDVESGIMPAYHYKLRVEPLPLWLEKWIGENGYPKL